jgi:hypothetical protein
VGLIVWWKRERGAENEVERIKAQDRAERVHGKVSRIKGKGEVSITARDGPPMVG